MDLYFGLRGPFLSDGGNEGKLCGQDFNYWVSSFHSESQIRD